MLVKNQQSYLCLKSFTNKIVSTNVPVICHQHHYSSQVSGSSFTSIDFEDQVLKISKFLNKKNMTIKILM